MPRCSLKSTAPASNPNQWCVSGTVESLVAQQDTTKSCGDGRAGIEGGNVPVKPSEVATAARTGAMVLGLRVLVDHSISELFAAGGRAAVTARTYPTPPSGSGDADTVALWAQGGSFKADVSVWPLGPAYSA